MKLLKNIIAFLIWQQEHPGKQREVWLRKNRLLGWYGQDDSSGKLKVWLFEQFTWNEKPIMYHRGSSDYSKFGINPDYIKHFDFQLINPEQVEVYQNNYWIIKDAGHGDEVPFIILNEKNDI